MAPWLISALRMLGLGLGATGAAELGSRAIEGLTPIDVPFFGELGESKKPRRRRRRMLTAGDVKDIAFLSTLLTGKNLAAVVTARIGR